MAFLLSRRGTTLLMVLLAAGLATLSHFARYRPLINDEAIELLQADGLPTDRFYFFAPPEAYTLNVVDTVETLVPYLNHFLFHVTPGLTDRARFVVPVRLACIVAFTAACALFYLTALRLWPPLPAVTAGVCLATSGYALLLNQFITRNSWSILWAATLAWLMSRWVGDERRPTPRRIWPVALGIAATLALGCWTYTSFKLMAPAVYGGLFAAWLRFDRRPAPLLAIAASGVAFTLVICGLVAADGRGFSLFFVRGGYAIAGASQYLRLLGLTLISPFYFVLHGGFIESDVHVIVGRAALSPLLAPFFIAGWVCAWGSRRPFWIWAAAAWTLGMAGCALGGPNLKYLYAFFPLTLLLALHGVMLGADRLRAVWPDLPRSIAPVALCLYAGWEIRSVFVVTPQSEYLAMNGIAERLADHALAASQRDGAYVMAQPQLGFDLVNWRLWPPADAARVRRWAEPEEMMDALAAGPPLPPGAVLFVDYPAREVCAKAGKPLPEALRVINVRDE